MFTDPKELYRYLVDNPSEIEKFVKENSESQILDYKSWSALKQPAAGQEVERLSHVVCSLANTDGGVILFGVCDSPRGLEKHKFSEKELENLQAVLSQQVNPPVAFFVPPPEKFRIREDCEVLLVLVPKSPFCEIYQVMEDMGVYVRRGGVSRKAFIAEVKALYSRYAERPQPVESARNAGALQPKLGDALNHEMLGLDCLSKSDFEGAVAHFSEAIKIDPSFESAYDNRAVARSYAGDFDGAIEDLRKALVINPRFVLAYEDRGFVYYAKGQIDRAIEEYNRAIRIDKDCADAYHGRALARYAKGDLEGAVVDFDKAVSLAPKNVNFRKNRSFVAVQLRKILLEKELGIFRDAVVEKLQPEQIVVYGSYARGDITERSDLDIIVILKSDKEFWDRQMLAAPFRSDKVGMDVSVYTPEEWEDKKVHNIFITQEVLPSMKVIYPKGEQDGGKTE